MRRGSADGLMYFINWTEYGISGTRSSRKKNASIYVFFTGRERYIIIYSAVNR